MIPARCKTRVQPGIDFHAAEYTDVPTANAAVKRGGCGCDWVRVGCVLGVRVWFDAAGVGV